MSDSHQSDVTMGEISAPDVSLPANKYQEDFIKRVELELESFLTESKADQAQRVEKLRELFHAERQRVDIDDITFIFLEKADRLICEMRREALLGTKDSNVPSLGQSAIDDMFLFVLKCVDTSLSTKDDAWVVKLSFTDQKRVAELEAARALWWFVRELKEHRDAVFGFGKKLGCSEEHLLQHDLCKMDTGNLKDEMKRTAQNKSERSLGMYGNLFGYAMFMHSMKTDQTKAMFFEHAWPRHQKCLHHAEAYQDPTVYENMSDEEMCTYAREMVADFLAATKVYKNSTMIDWATTSGRMDTKLAMLPVKMRNQVRDAYKDAHTACNEKKPNDPFTGFPCWSDEVEKAFIAAGCT